MRPSGAIPPMVTPASRDRGEIDVPALASFTEFLRDNGVHALFPCGSIGEFSSLTADQRRQVVETVVDHSGDVPVFAGCGGTGVEEVQSLLAQSADLGADAGVVVTPYYLTTTQEGLREFFDCIADAADIPLILYDIPPLTGNHLSVESVVDLAEHDNIIGIKDSTGDYVYHTNLIKETNDSFSILQGQAALSLASLNAGADGFVGGPANVFPTLIAETFEAYQSGDHERAAELVRDIAMPIVSATNEIPTATGLKYLLNKRGLDVGEPFTPLPLANRQEREILDDCFATVLATADVAIPR